MEQRRETKYFICFMLWALICFSGGCYLTDTKVDAVTGEEITKLEDITKKAQGYIEPVAPVANTFIPGSGIVIGGIALLLGLIGTTTTALVKAHRSGGALGVVIQGVGIANDAETKAKIETIAKSTGLYAYLHSLVKKYDPLSRKKSST